MNTSVEKAKRDILGVIENKEGLSRKQQLDQLALWLQGYDLPPVGLEWTPREWILNSLPEATAGAEISSSTRKLAELLATLLAELPSYVETARLKNNFLENAFSLATWLEVPEILGPSLAAQKIESLLDDCADDAILSLYGDACSYNPIENRFEEFYTKLAIGETTSIPSVFAMRNEEFGFMSLLRLPGIWF